MSDKLWCAMCGKWGDHRSGGCPELTSADRTPELPNSEARSLERHGSGSPFFDGLKDNVFVERCRDGNGLSFGWVRKGIGFGVLTLRIEDGKLVVDDECMNVEFDLGVIRQAITEAECPNTPDEPTPAHSTSTNQENGHDKH